MYCTYNTIPDEAAIVLLRLSMAGMVGVHVTVRQCRRRPEVVVHVQHIGQQRLGRLLLEVELLHLVLHHDGLPGDLLPGAGHAETPGDPLQEQNAHLHPHPQ
jgi:hypothetical protein